MQFRIAFNPQKETEKRERFHFHFPSQTPEHTSGYVCLRVCLSVFHVCVRVYKRVRDANCEVTGLILFIAPLFFPPSPSSSSSPLPSSAYSDVAERFCQRQTSAGFYSLPVYIFRYKAAGCIGSR